jgi:hypothetical protein
MPKHICGACGQEFDEETTYAGHTCPKTGQVASSTAHQDALTNGRFSKISAAALARGAAKQAQ